MTYNQARAAILSSEYNAQDHLSEVDYNQLLSQRKRNGFTVGRFNSGGAVRVFTQSPIRIATDSRSLDTNSSAVFPSIDHTNLELMAGAGVGVLCLILIARCRHNKLLAAPFSLIKFGGKKILGCFYQPDTSSTATLEVVVEKPNSLTA
jgi:hypothetical protein